MSLRPVALSAAATVILAACSGPVVQPKPDTRPPGVRLVAEVRDLPRVTKVTLSSGILDVEYLAPSADGSAPMLDSIALVPAIASKLKKTPGALASVKELSLQVSVPTIDNLGHDATNPIVQYFFHASDLGAANFDRLNPGRQVALSDDFVKLGVEGADSASAFCASPDSDGAPLEVCPLAQTGK